MSDANDDMGDLSEFMEFFQSSPCFFVNRAAGVSLTETLPTSPTTQEKLNPNGADDLSTCSKDTSTESVTGSPKHSLQVIGASASTITTPTTMPVISANVSLKMAASDQVHNLLNKDGPSDPVLECSNNHNESVDSPSEFCVDIGDDKQSDRSTKRDATSATTETATSLRSDSDGVEKFVMASSEASNSAPSSQRHLSLGSSDETVDSSETQFSVHIPNERSNGSRNLDGQKDVRSCVSSSLSDNATVQPVAQPSSALSPTKESKRNDINPGQSTLNRLLDALTHSNAQHHQFKPARLQPIDFINFFNFPEQLSSAVTVVPMTTIAHSTSTSAVYSTPTRTNLIASNPIIATGTFPGTNAFPMVAASDSATASVRAFQTAAATAPFPAFNPVTAATLLASSSASSTDSRQFNQAVTQLLSGGPFLGSNALSMSAGLCPLLTLSPQAA
ncbi:unnamed protein product, partial [Anisakis simplex]|uniref:Zinc finger protein n=1 Tax=Anisakis simplex TaxID=6269 RepID=A0A0M3KBI3_ANISI